MQSAAATAPPEVVGLVMHGRRADVRQAAAGAARRLLDAGVRVVGLADDGGDEAGVEAVAPERLASDADVVLSFGGDGTFLRAAWLARDHGTPVLGVNLGRLGFLTEVEAGDLDDALPKVLAGGLVIEERMTLDAVVRDAEGRELARSWALNEASLERDSPERLMVFEVLVGQTVFARVPADAVICATPTGSTAYAFSARGPIVSPQLDAILLVPVAPHSLFDRTVVVGAHETLAVRPEDGASTASISLDGRESLPIPQGGCAEVARSDRSVRMARLRPFDFYTRVRDKFGLH